MQWMHSKRLWKKSVPYYESVPQTRVGSDLLAVHTLRLQGEKNPAHISQLNSCLWQLFWKLSEILTWIKIVRIEPVHYCFSTLSARPDNKHGFAAMIVLVNPRPQKQCPDNTRSVLYNILVHIVCDGLCQNFALEVVVGVVFVNRSQLKTKDFD